MSLPANILADRDEFDVVQILVIVALLAGGAIVSLIQKAVKKAQEKQKKAKEELAPSRVAPPKAEQRPVKTVDQNLARSLRRTMGMPERPAAAPTPQPRAQRPPPPPPPDPGECETVHAHLAEMEKPKVTLPSEEAQQELKRSRRRKGKLGRALAPADEPETRQPVAQPVADLADPDAARQAILYHEILSPPKALRDQPEMWEL